MILIRNFKNIFKIPELVNKILFTFGVLVVYRIGIHIPVIGIDIESLKMFMEHSPKMGNFLSFFDTLSGGALKECTVLSLGVTPYITASIMMQILSLSIPYLETLSKEGDYGRKLINQYTRYLGVVLSVGYALAYSIYLSSRGSLVIGSQMGFIFTCALSLTVGSVITMWLGEQISLFGVGNGSSMIIFAGIVSSLPIMIDQLFKLEPIYTVLGLISFILLSAAVVFLEKGERKVQVQYAKRVVGNRIYGAQSTYIPFKINSAGVMPVIFASSVINIPTFLLNLLVDKLVFLRPVLDALATGGPLNNILMFCLIMFFTFFYTAIAFNPVELADNIKKSGGFIPGIRPGKNTANFFDYILNRVGLVGALYLGVLAIIPNILYSWMNVRSSIGGTSILIMVGVALELAAQIEAYLIEHRYEGFLISGKKGRTGG